MAVNVSVNVCECVCVRPMCEVSEARDSRQTKMGLGASGWNKSAHRLGTYV